MANPDFLTTTFEKANCLELSRGLKNRGPDPKWQSVFILAFESQGHKITV